MISVGYKVLILTSAAVGDIVLDAILTPTPESTLTDPTSPSGSAASSPTLVNKPRPSGTRHGLEMLANVLRNTENPAVYPVEIQANVCTFLIQLYKGTKPSPKLSQLQDTIRPVLESLKESPSFDKEELLSTSVHKVLEAWRTG